MKGENQTRKDENMTSNDENQQNIRRPYIEKRKPDEEGRNQDKQGRNQTKNESSWEITKTFEFAMQHACPPGEGGVTGGLIAHTQHNEAEN